MLKYRGSRLFRQGIVGIVVIVCVILVGLNSQKFVKSTLHYEAVFTEAGGLSPGANVEISGSIVGTVSKISLREGDAVAELSINSKVGLGSETSAHIKTGSLLGARVVALVSDGPGRMHPHDVIPANRTSSPYSLTDAVGDLTTNAAGLDTTGINQSLDALSSTLNSVAPQLGATFDGLTGLSRALNSRDQSLRDLLRTTADVTGILAQRSEQVNGLILNANSLLGVLVDRRDAIVSLLANVNAVANQLTGLVHDNEAELAPTLDRLNSIAAVLEKDRDSIAQTLPNLAKSAMGQGEAVASGPFYQAFVANLVDGRDIQPFLDAAFGIEPRSQLPLPHLEPPR